MNANNGSIPIIELVKRLSADYKRIISRDSMRNIDCVKRKRPKSKRPKFRTFVMKIKTMVKIIKELLAKKNTVKPMN